MQQSKQRKSKLLLWPALAAAIALGGATGQAMAEGSSSKAEVQRGVPGVDVDVNKSSSKGVDVDLQAGNKNDSDNGVPGVDVDARKSGAGPDTRTMASKEQRRPIQDRN